MCPTVHASGASAVARRHGATASRRPSVAGASATIAHEPPPQRALSASVSHVGTERFVSVPPRVVSSSIHERLPLGGCGIAVLCP